jgi:hypothetical protein
MTGTTELYQLPEGAKIYGLEPNGDKDGVIIFGHLDGIYAYCWVEGQPDKIVHLKAYMPLKKYKDGWRVYD